MCCLLCSSVTILDVHWLLGTARIDLPVILVVGIAARAGAEDAARLGFMVGLTVDFFQFGPFGLNALVLCLVAWTLAEAKVRMLQPGALFHSVQSAVAVVLATVVAWTAAFVFGLTPPPLGVAVFANITLVGLAAAALVHPATWVAGLFLEARSNTDRRGAEILVG
ncbi:MAG: rod shape-determining protein MreD [Acidimicrobiales bacterium]